MNTLSDFLKQTIVRFDELEYDDNTYFINDYEIDLWIKATKDGYLYSEVRGRELARIELKEYNYYIYTDDLIKLLRTPIFHKWLSKKDENYNEFQIFLEKGLPYELLVHVSNGVFHYGCWSHIRNGGKY